MLSLITKSPDTERMTNWWSTSSKSVLPNPSCAKSVLPNPSCPFSVWIAVSRINCLGRALPSDSFYTCNVKFRSSLSGVCVPFAVVALPSGSVDACKSMHIMNIIMLIWVLNMPTDSVYFFIIESRWLAVYAGIRINELHVWIGIFAGTARSKYWICRQTLDTFLFLDLDHSL